MRLLAVIGLSAFCLACAARSARPEFAFANKLAQQGLWKEALYRWESAQKHEGKSAALHNNIALAYEQLGRFAEAEREYREAMRLDPQNRLIKTNYESFQKAMARRKQ